jgi:S-adenosylmethionine:tRNA ribosyltransferase-isomerase
VLTADFDFELPPELIAQHPLPQRDASRLLVVHRASGSLEHRAFSDIVDYLRPGDVMVLNNSRVIPARLRAMNARTSGKFEVLLLEENAENDWWVMLRPGKRAQLGAQLTLLDANGNPTPLNAVVTEINQEGHRRLKFSGPENVLDVVERIGEVPLPPYIERKGKTELEADKERYQTVYANPAGSVAAPTAGLHFTPALLERVATVGVEVHFVTLHVGLGTFAPVKSDNITDHTMHEERYEVPPSTADAINRARAENRRIIAVGTTSLRVLESATAGKDEPLKSGPGRARIFIYPPYQFRCVDLLLTNFHLPRSTLIMLVSAFATPGEPSGRETVLHAYRTAIENRYRFFSYGDAMLLC